MSDEHWSEFGELHGYKFTRQATDHHAASWFLPYRTADDQLRFAHDWGRNCRLPLDQVPGRCPTGRVAPDQFRTYIERLGRFKAERGLTDFCDMLAEVLEGEMAPPVDVAFIDEAQDLSPLQIAVVEMWFENVSRVYVGGDDDQTLFTFQGADPTWLLDLAKGPEVEILKQSHRVPVIPHALAQRIIRQNRNRVAKEYLPAETLGSVQRLPQHRSLEQAAESSSAFVLVRNRHFIRGIAAGLMRRGVPYVVEGQGGVSPLSDGRLMTAVRTAYRLRRWGTSLGANELDALLRFVPTSPGLVPRGAKTKVKQAKAAAQTFKWEAIREDLGLAGLIEAIRKTGPIAVLTKLEEGTRDYLQRIVGESGDLPEPSVVVTTIHGSKGREKSLVVVIPDMSRATYRAYRAGSREDRELENRIFYVAVTRTKKDLIIAEPITRRAYEFPALAHAEGVV